MAATVATVPKTMVRVRRSQPARRAELRSMALGFIRGGGRFNGSASLYLIFK